MRSVAASMNRTARTLRNWFEREERPTPRRLRQVERRLLLNDTEWLEEQYVTKRRSITEIAAGIAAPPAHVAEALHHANIARKAKPRHVEVSAEVLKRAVADGESQRAVADRLGVGRGVVRAAAQRHNIVFGHSLPRRPAKLGERNWLAGQILHQQRTVREIADSLGTSTATVERARRQLGIAPGRRPRRLDRPSLARELRRLYIDERLTIAEIAARFDVSSSTVYRAIERHGLTRQGRGKRTVQRDRPLSAQQSAASGASTK